MRLIARKVSTCRKCSRQIALGTAIDWEPGDRAAHAVCPTYGPCPNCGEAHGPDELCYGGFDPDADELRWDGQP